MGIPYGTTYTATVKGSTFNEVECENCQVAFVYRLEREVSASQTSVLWLDNKGASERSSQQAHAALVEELKKAVDPVACPNCGWYQPNMCKILKRRRLHIALWICLPLATVLLIWGLVTTDKPGNHSAALIISALCIAGFGVVGGFVWSMLHSPNGSHPGKSGKNSELAATSRGINKAEHDAKGAKEREEWEEKFHRYLLQMMLQMAAADGTLEEAELQSVGNIYQQITGDELETSMLQGKAAELQSQTKEMLRNMQAFSADLADEAKDLYIRAGIAIAAADGEVDQPEWELLIEIGQALNMTELRFRAVLDSMQSK